MQAIVRNELTIKAIFNYLQDNGVELFVPGYYTLTSHEHLELYIRDHDEFYAFANGVPIEVYKAYMEWNGYCTGKNKNGKQCKTYVGRDNVIRKLEDCRCKKHKNQIA